jgi:hypothetical protein
MLIISILSIRKLILISVLTQLPNVSNVAKVIISGQSHLVIDNINHYTQSHIYKDTVIFTL